MTYFVHDNYNVYDLLPCSAAVFLINESLDIVYSNAVYNETFAARSIIVSSGDRKGFDSILAKADTPQCTRFKSKNARGKEIHVRTFMIKISSEKAFALFIDDSESAETIKRLGLQCSRYACAISGTDEIFFEYDKTNDRLSIFLSSDDGLATRDMENFIKELDENKLVHRADKDLLASVLQNGIVKETVLDIHMHFDPKDNYEWHRLIIKPGRNSDIYAGSARNINLLKSEEERLKKQVLFDPLSKVYNRASAIEKINERLKNRSADNSCALIVLDIDNFKTINDTFGHLYGDAVIAMAAGSVKSALDKDDIIGRFGGDEFFAFIDDAKPEHLEKKLEDIRLSIVKMRIDQQDDNDISCSIGVAIGAGGSDYEELFKRADSALYAAKKNGKNRFEYFNGVYIDESSLSYVGNHDENESNEAHNIIEVALEIASKSQSAENAIANIMRHIGIAEELDIIQVFKYDTVDDRVYIEFQWWRELSGAYNVVLTEKKMGYYAHNDLILFKDRFIKDKTFRYTPDFKEGFSKKYYDVFTNSEHINIVHSSNTANESVFYSVAYESFDKNRVWTEQEFSDMSEITKIISMYLKSSYVTTDREKMLMKHIDYDWTGLFTFQKFFEESGRIGRTARQKGEKLAVIHLDIQDLYKINLTYGRDVGDSIIEAISDMFLKGDTNSVIACHIDGTDQFLCLFSGHDQDKAAAFIEKGLDSVCAQFAQYTDPPVILKAGLAFFNPGEYVVIYSDAACAVKKGKVFDKSRCIIAEDVKTEYPPDKIYVPPADKRMQ